MSTITLACNFYKEPNALPGLLENASQFFDDLFFLHCPPAGASADDESIAIIEKWGARWEPYTLEKGFGDVRTQLIRRCKTSWVWISDCDERFYPIAPALSCEGTEAYPQVENPRLHVYNAGGCYEQGNVLLDLMRKPELMAICVSRRHWFDFSWQRPCQNWMIHHDLQLRCVRNSEHLTYVNVMHEHLRDLRTGRDPEHNKPILGPGGLFVDHYHCHFKAMEKEQRQEDIAVYDALHAESVKKR